MIEHAEGAVLVSSIASAMDVRRLRAGQPYTLDRLLDGRVRRFEYEIDGDRRLIVARASFEGAPRFIAAVDRIPKHSDVVAIEGEINRENNSLTAALDKAGERIELALGMADVFSGEIDFNSDLQPGDRFRVLVERQTREGRLSGYGPILAAEFVNDGRTLEGDPLHARRRRTGVLRRAGPVAETVLPEVAAEVRAADHVALLELAQAPDPRLRPRPQRRRLSRADRRAGGLGGAGRGDDGGMDGGRGTHREGAAPEWVRNRVPAPVVDRRPCRRAHFAGRSGRPCRQDRSGHRTASSLRPEEERPLREPDHRAPQHAARRARAGRIRQRVRVQNAIATSRCSIGPQPLRAADNQTQTQTHVPCSTSVLNGRSSPLRI